MINFHRIKDMITCSLCPFILVTQDIKCEFFNTNQILVCIEFPGLITMAAIKLISWNSLNAVPNKIQFFNENYCTVYII